GAPRARAGTARVTDGRLRGGALAVCARPGLRRASLAAARPGRALSRAQRGRPRDSAPPDRDAPARPRRAPHASAPPARRRGAGKTHWAKLVELSATAARFRVTAPLEAGDWISLELPDELRSSSLDALSGHVCRSDREPGEKTAWSVAVDLDPLPPEGHSEL